MKILRIENINEIVAILNDGGIIAFPTDTVYGLGCRYDLIEAIDKIKEAKGRDNNKPLPMMVNRRQAIEEVAIITNNASKVIDAFMPGAITIILNKKDSVPSFVTNGLDTIGIRIPDDEVVIKILDSLNKPMLVTSANKSATPSKLNSDDVITDLGDYLDGIILGTSKGLMASTLVDMRSDLLILRAGLITKEDIEEVIRG